MQARFTRVLACLALLTIAVAARAQPDVEQARQLFADAQALEEAGQWAAAARKLEDAIAVKDTPGLRYHLAYCQERLGRWVEALSNYDRARALLEAGSQADDVAARLEPARAELASRMPTLWIRVDRPPTGSRVRLDDREVEPAELGKPIAVDPGTHRVAVTAPGHRSVERVVTLRAGERTVAAIALEPVAPPAPRVASVSPAPSRGPSARTTVIIVEASVAAVALGVGIGYGVARGSAADRARAARSDLDERAPSQANACHAPSDDLSALCADLARANEDGVRASRAATIGWIGAGIAAAAGVATWLFWDPEGSTRELRIGVATTPGGLMGGLSGSF
jgi:tetratricopeptide (TPR) repeat protein